MRNVVLLLIVCFQIGCSSGQNQSVESGSIEGPRTLTVVEDTVEPTELAPIVEEDETSQEQAARLDPVATGLRQAPVPKIAVRSVAFNSDGSLIATGNGLGEIAIWSPDERMYVKEWQGHDHWVFDLNFDKESNRLVSAGGDDLTKFWNTESWQQQAKFEDHDDDVHGAVLTSDDSLLVTGGDDTNVIVRNLDNDEVSVLEGHDAQVTSVLITPDDQLAFSSSRDQTIRGWDLKTLKSIGVLEGHTEDVLHIAVDRAGKHLASASYDGTVRIWSIDEMELVKVLNVSAEWVFAVAFSSDGNHLITGGGDSLVRVYDWQSGEILSKMNLSSDVSDLAVSPDGTRVAAATSMYGTHVFSFQDGKLASLHSFGKEVGLVETPPLSLEDYLSVHSVLIHEHESDDWGQKVGLLSMSGDVFTLALLEDIDVETLPAPKRELARRLRSRLELRFPSQKITPDQRREFWERLAVAELLDSPIRKKLRTWFMAQSKNQLPFPQIAKTRIEQSVKNVISDTAAKHQLIDKSEEIQKEILADLEAVFAESNRE